MQFGDPVLKSKALPVSVFDDALRAEIARMGGLMDDALGVGLAATQVGRLRRLLVYGSSPTARSRRSSTREIEWSSKDEEVFEEGCLSLRGRARRRRAPDPRARARPGRRRRARSSIEASGLEARVIQHEMDHLDGVLILDRAPRDQRREAMRALREQASDAAA